MARSRIESYRRVKHKVHGYHSREAHVFRRWIEAAAVEVTVDLEGICQQAGLNAVHSKRGHSRLMAGLIKAKVLRRVEHDVRSAETPVADGYEILEVLK